MNNIEKRLLSKTRFFNGLDHEIEELLDKRYSTNSGLQKSFLWLKPTGMKDENVNNEYDDDDAKINAEEETNEAFNTNKGTCQMGNFDAKTFPWKGLDSNISETRKKNLKRNDRIQLKKQKKTTRLSFKVFIEEQLLNRRRQVKQIKKINKKEGYIKNINRLQLFSNQYSKTNKLWLGYIKELINGVNDMQQILTRLSSAEYVGAMIRVTSSSKDLNNLVGIVVYEFKNSWLICVPNGLKYGKEISIDDQEKYLLEYLETLAKYNDPVKGLPRWLLDRFTASEIVGGLKMIQKKNCMFKFMIPYTNSGGHPNNSGTSGESSSAEVANYESLLRKLGNGGEQFLEFTIIGNRFMFKSIDRSNKKFKSHGADDLNFTVSEEI